MTEKQNNIDRKKRLARTYDTHENPYQVVRDYYTVQQAAAKHPEKGSAALATEIGMPRPQVRGWTEKESIPHPVAAIETARSRGWLAPSPELAALAGHLLSGGVIRSDDYLPQISTNTVDRSHAESAFEAVGVTTTTYTAGTETTNIIPATDGPLLGRCLVAWGLSAGSHTDTTELPALIDDDEVDAAGKRAFLKAYLRHGMNAAPTDEPTVSIRKRQPAFREQIAELVEDVTGETATAHKTRLSVSPAALEALGLHP